MADFRHSRPGGEEDLQDGDVTDQGFVGVGGGVGVVLLEAVEVLEEALGVGGGGGAKGGVGWGGGMGGGRRWVSLILTSILRKGFTAIASSLSRKWKRAF